MTQVAILGTEGCGKTVLMAVMALLFRRDRAGIQLVPQTAQTSQHAAELWKCLQSGLWPASSPEGQLRELKWELLIDGSPNCNLRFMEISGQDFRALFGKDQVNQVSELSPQKQELAKYIDSADIVCFLVNLGDFIGESDQSRREESQWALMSALDSIHRRPWPKRCSIVFTRADEFKVYKDATGSWKNVARQYLPYVHGTYVRHGKIPIHPVAAVASTVVGMNSKGEPCRMPAKELKSRGLEDLIKWIGKSAKELQSQDAVDANEEGSSSKTESPKVPGSKSSHAFYPKDIVTKVCIFIVTFVFFCILKAVLHERPALNLPRSTEINQIQLDSGQQRSPSQPPPF